MNFKFKILFHEQYVKYLILYHFGLENVNKTKLVKYCSKKQKNHIGVKLKKLVLS